MILDQKHNDIPLFLAIKQGFEKGANHIHVIINPKVRNKARQQLVEDYSSAIFQIKNNNEISVDSKKFAAKMKYNENLKELLCPLL